MRIYIETRSKRKENLCSCDADLLAIPAVLAIRRRAAVSPVIAYVRAGLIGFTLEVR
jgi:hypothetical protein